MQRRNRFLAISLAQMLFGMAAPAIAEEERISMTAPPPPVFLQGSVQQLQRIPAACPRIMGFQTYQQGWFLLGQQQFAIAADYFAMAGDQMEASAGGSKYLAEARFAEAQTRRLIGQYDRSRDLYKKAVALFEKFDPASFYLQAAKNSLKELGPAKTDTASPARPLKATVKKEVVKPKAGTLRSMPMPMTVNEHIPLSAKVTQLDTGESINSLHDGDFFNRSRGTIPQAAAVDISEKYLKDIIHKAFLKMNCLETAAVGANHYTAANSYVAIRSEGKPVAVGAGNDLLSPTAELILNGKTYRVLMDLPQISPNSRNVLLSTDGRTVIAIDPRTSDAWKLCANFAKKVPDFSWWKLGRVKGRKF